MGEMGSIDERYLHLWWSKSDEASCEQAAWKKSSSRVRPRCLCWVPRGVETCGAGRRVGGGRRGWGPCCWMTRKMMTTSCPPRDRRGPLTNQPPPCWALGTARRMAPLKQKQSFNIPVT